MTLFDHDLTVLFDTIVDAVFVHPFPVEGTPQPFVFVNQAACDLLGYSREALLGGMSIPDIDGSGGDVDLRPVFAALGRGERARFEQHLLHADGSPIPVEIHTLARVHHDTRYIVSSVRDMTRRKAAEALLLEREELLDLFFRQSLDGFFFMMLDEPLEWTEASDKEAALDVVFATQRITRMNQAFLDQYAAEEADLLGSTPADFFDHDLEYGRDVWRRFFDAGHLHVDTQERRLDGSALEVEGDYICLYDDQGRITGHFGVQRDITTRSQSLALLQLQRDVATALAGASTLEEACEAVLDAALAVAGVDNGGVYLVASDGALHLEASRGLSAAFVESAAHHPADGPHAAFARAGEPMFGQYDLLMLQEDGVRRSEGLRAMASIPVVHEGETLAVLNVASHTIDALADHSRRALEAVAAQVGGALARLRAMEQVERAELHARAQETLLREVNHRVKNNLSAIMGILHLEEDRARASGAPGTAGAISEIVGRVRGLAKVHELASRRGWSDLLVTDLCERVLHSAMQAASHEILLRIHPSEVQVDSARAHHLALVLNELVTNSLKHAGSLLDIEVRVSEEGGSVLVVYRDDGPGYPEAVLAGRHHGIGLELSLGIASRSLRGELVLDNADGARATLTFPAKPEA